MPLGLVQLHRLQPPHFFATKIIIGVGSREARGAVVPLHFLVQLESLESRSGVKSMYYSVPKNEVRSNNTLGSTSLTGQATIISDFFHVNHARCLVF